MEEMISSVAQRAGVSPEQAKTAVETVMNYLKTHVGGQFAGLAGMLGSLGQPGQQAQGSEPPASGGLGDLGKKFGL